jgi:cobalt-precorrin 5A hydrolase/precorrin-3B C17-methyltransferase
MSTRKRGLAPNKVYPITLTALKKALVVVVGGGRVGERKIEGLLAVGVNVRLISPQATSRLRALAEAGKIEWLQRVYQNGDLAGARLAFAATDQRDVNARVASEAKGLNLLHNIVDKPDEGNFHLPAVYRDENLVVTVSTAGVDPGQARLIRDNIAQWLKTQPQVAARGEVNER